MILGKRILFLSLLSSAFVFSQSKENENLFISANFKFGSVLPEYQFVHSLVDKNIQQVEISVFKETNGENYWQKLYKYPKLGFSLFYTSLGNNELLGHELALFPFVSLQSSPSKKFHVENKFGLGVGFVTRKFDLQENYKNVAVGSKLNVHFSYDFGLNYNLNSKLNLKSCLSFNHFSNANMKEPNLGINTVSASIGLDYLLGKRTERLSPEIPEFIPNNEFAFVYAFGGKHTRALQQTVYFTSSLSFEYKRKIRQIFHLGGGLDLFYDASTKTEMSVPGKIPYKSIYDFKTGFHFSQEFVYNKFSFILQEGFYVGLTDKVDKSPIYNRAIFRYKWNQHFFTHISMKSHLYILDYPEIGFAYYF
ncbi:MAG: acyloxyacyl hydrolase [Bacteroidota bacterium]